MSSSPVTNKQSTPVTLVGPAPDKRQYVLIPGRPVDVPEDVLARYMDRPNFQHHLSRREIVIGGKEARLVEDLADKAVAKLRKKVNGEAKSANMHAYATMDKPDLVLAGKALGLDLDEQAPREDWLASIRQHHEEGRA